MLMALIKPFTIISMVMEVNNNEFSGFEFSNEVTINRPIEHVFSFLSNFENMAKWNYWALSDMELQILYNPD